MTPDEALLDWRRRKDAFFASANSPLPPEARAAFAGLAYFPPDPARRFEVEVEPLGGEPVELGTTTGEPRAFARFGLARFDLDGTPASLVLYAPLGEEAPARVFVPFRDATNGAETYGAGRYLDAPLRGDPDAWFVTLDFNLAYAPYCAYGEGWTCPLPPRENWLTAPVRAGEKLG